MSTSREIVETMMRGGRPERIALREGPWSDTIAAWVQQGYPMRQVYREVGEKRWREDGRMVDVEVAGEYPEPVPAWEHFGFDMVGIGGIADVNPMRGYSELVSETDEWEVRRNGAGAALKYWKHKSGTPEHIDFLMKDRETWEKTYKPLLLDLDPERLDIRAVKQTLEAARQAQAWSHFSGMFIWEIMRQSMGDVTLYESLVLDPGWIHDYGRTYTDFFKRHMAYLIEQVGLPDGAWMSEDLGYKNGLFASPRVLRELIFPYFAELVTFYHSYNLPVVLHTCGSVAEALPLVVEAGFDGLHPMERKALNNDPFVFAEEYGDKLVFIGGLDTRVFETNDKETIRREVAAYIEGMKARGARLVFGSDHSISTNTHYDSYLYGVQVYRDHMWY